MYSWIESVTGIVSDSSQSIGDYLRSGVVLCELGNSCAILQLSVTAHLLFVFVCAVNKISPGTIKKIAAPKNSAFMMENIKVHTYSIQFSSHVLILNFACVFFRTFSKHYETNSVFVISIYSSLSIYTKRKT